MRQLIAVALFCAGLFCIAQAQVPMTGAGLGAPSSGGFSPSCSQSSTFLAAATGVVLTADKTNYDTLICGLVTDSNWNFDALYIFAAPTNTNASTINLAQPGTFNATELTSPTFTAYQGYTGNGSNNGLDSNLNPSSAGSTNCSGLPCYTLNSATLGAYVLSADTAGTKTDIGSTGASGNANLTPYTGGNVVIQLNDTSNLSVTNSGSSQGAWNGTRTSSGARAIYLNSSETAVGSDSTASTGLPNDLTILFYSGVGNFSNHQVAAIWISKGLSAVNSCKVNNRINTYMASLAVPKNVYSNSAC